MYDASRVFLDTLGANGFADARPAAIESDARVVGMNFIVANQMAWMGLGGWRVAEGCRALYNKLAFRLRVLLSSSAFPLLPCCLRFLERRALRQSDFSTSLHPLEEFNLK